MITELRSLTAETATEHESFMVCDILGILEELKPNTKIIELDYEYNENLKKEFDDYLAEHKSEDTVFCTVAYVSIKEFPEEEYYIRDEEAGKKPLPYDKVLERDSKVLTECGFININDFIGYEYKVAFIYPNEIGNKVIERILTLVSEFEANKKQ